MEINPKDPKIMELSGYIRDRQKALTKQIKSAAEKAGVDADVIVHVTLKPITLEEQGNGGK